MRRKTRAREASRHIPECSALTTSVGTEAEITETNAEENKRNEISLRLLGLKRVCDDLID